MKNRLQHVIMGVLISRTQTNLGSVTNLLVNKLLEIDLHFILNVQLLIRK